MGCILSQWPHTLTGFWYVELSTGCTCMCKLLAKQPEHNDDDDDAEDRLLGKFKLK